MLGTPGKGRKLSLAKKRYNKTNGSRKDRYSSSDFAEITSFKEREISNDFLGNLFKFT